MIKGEKNQGAHGKYPKKLEKQLVKHEETNGETGETCRELPQGGFVSRLVNSFQAASCIAGFTHECRICLISKSVHTCPLFPWLSPTPGILCKIYLNGGQSRVQISYFCLIISWRISHTDIRNVIKNLNIWFIL